MARTHGSPDDAATQSLVPQAEALLAAAADQAYRARAAAADALQREPGDEAPDSVGEAFLTAAGIEQMLGNASEERAHLTLVQAHALF